MQNTLKHYFYVPFLGLGLYGGSRGKRWLKNRISIFKQFVVPSLLAQTNQNFSLWVSWRREDRGNKDIQLLELYLRGLFGFERVIFTYSGVCFWDDKYPDEEAHTRLVTSLHQTMTELINHIGGVDTVLMTIQPSDDCYHTGMVDEVQTLLRETDAQAVGYSMGYIANYKTLEVKDYNPETNPPFFTIKFPKSIFIDPLQHMLYTGPYKSHEYVGNTLRYVQIPKRGFLVGCHGENISTHFNLPYAGEQVNSPLTLFGLEFVKPIKICYSIRKKLMQKLPHRVQRKLRYIFGEKIYQTIYKLIHG
jgi:hypothetical protein